VTGRGVTRMVVTSPLDEAQLAQARRPQDHFVREARHGPDRFGLDIGPFREWERTIEVDPRPGPDGRRQVTTTLRFAMAVPVWGPAFTWLVRHNLRRTGGIGRRSWWMPALMDARSSGVVAILAVFSLYAGYLGVLLSQTNAFFKAEFGSSSAEIADAQIATRIGAFAALAVVALADRQGRRRILLASTVLGIVLAATGALAPNLLAMTTSQAVARVFSAAMVLVGAVMVTEEVPAGARASALSVLALAAGLGSGGVVALLWVGGLSPSAWRILFLVPLPFLLTVPALARRLPETKRYEAYDLRAKAEARAPVDRANRSTFRRRVALVGAALLFFNFFLTPYGGFTNDFLLIERDFAAWQLTAFQVLTNLPGGAAIVLGGELADRYGRKVVSVIGVVGGTAAGVVQFLTDGWVLWGASTVAAVLLGLLVPSLLVYPTELFPTRWRGRAQGYTNLAAVAGAVVGLRLCGMLADRFGSYSPAVATLAAGPLVVAVLVVVAFPETKGMELETINPEDQPPPAGDELTRLDQRWKQQATHEHGRL
jgi:MFS family permease